MESIATKCSLPIKLVINPFIITSENIVMSLELNIESCVLLLSNYTAAGSLWVLLLGIITCTCEWGKGLHVHWIEFKNSSSDIWVYYIRTATQRHIYNTNPTSPFQWNLLERDVCLVCLEFSVPLENFLLRLRCHHYRCRASNFDLCSTLMAIEQWGFFSVPHQLWYETYAYNGHFRGPLTLAPNAERFAVELF